MTNTKLIEMSPDFTFGRDICFNISFKRKKYLTVKGSPSKNKIWYEVIYNGVELYKGKSFKAAQRKYNKV